MDDHKWKVMESEMDRFEAEISSLGSSAPAAGGGLGSAPTTSGLFIPASVVRRAAGTSPIPKPPVSAGPVIISGAPQVYKAGPANKGPSVSATSSYTTISAPPTSMQGQIPSHVRPSLIAGASQITTAVGSSPRLIPMTATGEADIKTKVEPNLSRISSSLEGSAHSGAASTSTQKFSTTNDAATGSSPTKGKKKKKKGDDSAASPEKKPRKHVRSAGGTVWEDPTLLDWDPNDFRLFCGDLGNDVTDEVLARVFGRYASFQKAKVVRDKRTNKTRGYGFVSFKDPNDFVRAIRELDGRYVGSRPIKLRKSTWKGRSLNQVRKREKEFKQLMGPKKAKL